MKRRNIFFLLVGLFLSGLVNAQPPKTPYLERVVSIHLEQETLASALKKIGQAAGCTFSYNPDILEADKSVVLHANNKTVRQVLDQLFGGTIQYKERKRHIILTRTQTSSNDSQKVSGYVVDEATGERLKNVSIYDPVSLSSAVTDAYGFFQIEIPKPSNEEVRLEVQKRNYTDTVLVASGKNGLVNIQMKNAGEKIDALADSVGKKLKRFWLSTKQATVQAINMENINDTLHKKFQFSIVPFVGTNHKLSGNIINDYSLNLLGGYSLGVEKLEVGGLFNSVRGNVKGVQIAGLVNGVAGETEAVQIAGLINANRQYTRAVQVAGLVNFNWDSSRTVALAGLSNFIFRDTRGVKIAGLGNVVIQEQRGPHIAGLFNFTMKDANAVQTAGLFNFTVGSMKGAQIAGLMNVAVHDVRGAQVSGLLNLAPGKIRGAQVGLLNYATKINGAQVGLINVADSLKGVPIGFLTFVSRGGYHKIEISADEIFYTNLAFRTGVRTFYNIFTAGAKPDTFDDDETLWTFGYGVGTAPRLSQKLYLNIDLIANQVVKGNTIEEVNMINKLYLGVEYQVARKLGLTAGVTLNGYVTDTTYDQYPELFTDYKPHFIADHTYSNDMNLKMWWGAKIGVRFL